MIVVTFFLSQNYISAMNERFRQSFVYVYASASEPDLGRVLGPLVDTSTVLANPTLVGKLTWDSLKTQLPKFEGNISRINSIDRDMLLHIRGRKDTEEVYKQMFPARSKNDLAIRRSRVYDFHTYWKKVKPAFLSLVLGNCRRGWDYIFVMNILCFSAVLGEDWYKRLLRLGCFDGDISYYTVCAKKMNDLIKTRGVDDPDWHIYVEAGTLVGYRNLPYPGFDPIKETENLAKGGLKFDLFGYEFDNLVKEYLPMDVPPVNYISFRDFIMAGEWATAGSSSEGRIVVTDIDGNEIGDFKARKNLAVDVLDLEELVRECLSWSKQVNYTIIKSELGKVRLAVASDLQTYLQMTWILKFLGGAYSQWPGSTTDETFEEQTKRMWKMLKLCVKKLGLPFDYKAFDHQPTTEQLVSIMKWVCYKARSNIPVTGLAEYDQVCDNVIRGFYNSELSWRAEKVTYKVEGGLCSGLRVTSIVGNAWNSIMTGLVLKLVASIGLSVDEVERYIRGDDSAIYVTSWGLGSLIKMTYDVCGVEAGDGKFSIQSHAMEFLRIWYGDRTYGYACRAIPGLTQRKPWSSGPWSDDNVIKSIYDTICTLRRRTGFTANIDRLWNHLKYNWCSLHNVPAVSLSIPRHLGGFGIEPVTDAVVRRMEPSIKKLLPRKPLVRVYNATQYRESQIKDRIRLEYNITLNNERLKEVADEQRGAILTADDIPAVSKLYREYWNKELSKARFVIDERRVPILDEIRPIDINAFGEDIDMLMKVLHERAPQYGIRPHLRNIIQDYKIIQPSVSLRQWIREHDAISSYKLNQFHHSWHMAEAIDYLTGDFSFSTYSLHPMLTRLLHLIVAAANPPSRKFCRNTVPFQAFKYEKEIYNTHLSQRIYRW